jgi:isopentenyl-diphosphate delta-isomerase type 1
MTGGNNAIICIMEEYIDIINQDGSKTGEVKLKSEVHKSGNWHRTVHVWILNRENKLLIQLRSPSKIQDPNLWDISCAGHISAGEDSKTAAMRELKEELGISVFTEELKLISEVTDQSVTNGETFINNEIHDIFLIRKDIEIDEMTLQDDEVSEVKWIDHLELKKDLKANPSKYVIHDEEYRLLFEHLSI